MCRNHLHHASRRPDAVVAAGDRPQRVADDLRKDPALRASDAEREQVADLLRQHAGEGRLSVDELSERLEQGYAARTRGELATLLDDLPPDERIAPQGGQGEEHRRGGRRGRGGPGGGGGHHRGHEHHSGRGHRRGRHRREPGAELRLYLAVSALLVAVWLVTGGGFFWPIWAIVGWGVWVVPAALAARQRGRRPEAVRLSV